MTTPIPNCPRPETTIRERAWADGQRQAEPKYSNAEIEAMCVCLNNLEQRGESFRVTPSEFRHLRDMLHSLLTERADSRPSTTDKAGVSDADVDAACRAYIAADRFLLDGAVESMREPMRAALAHFASRDAEAVRDAARWRHARKILPVRARFEAWWVSPHGFSMTTPNTKESYYRAWQAAHADLSGEVRELATEVIEAINDGDAQSARNAAQAALAKFAHQEPRA